MPQLAANEKAVVVAQRTDAVDRHRPHVERRELGVGAGRVVERRVDRTAGQRARHREEHAFGPAGLDEVIVDDRGADDGLPGCGTRGADALGPGLA